MKANTLDILKKYWGFDAFKPSQEKIINALLDDRDVMALLPTGGGKSVCFQVPALAKEGICIVVSPLVALIQNQVTSLKDKGIKAIALTGGIAYDEVINLLDNCLYGNYKFLYLSPERLQQEIVQERIQRMNVNLIAIDEAHCISQWGHDFRPAYLECTKLRALLPETPLVALTATATEQVATDIIDCLKFIDPVVVKGDLARTNIALNVFWDEDKKYRLKLLCAAIKTSAIVYVRTRRLAVEIAGLLNSSSCTAAFYHGGISKTEKKQKLNLWLENKVKVMVATNAFGMGIDKADVELVVHYQVPDCLENYFQEAGRAGRNGKPAKAILITNTTDIERAKKQFLSVLPDTKFLKHIYNRLNNYFQIPYGEGNDMMFTLNFNQFCATYNLNPLLSYNALQLLDQNSVLSLSESFSKKSTVQFIASKAFLFSYLERNKNLVEITQALLRTYGGIFDFETKINTFLIAKKTNTSEVQVVKVLSQLSTDEIINYSAVHNDLEITFLVPREDDSTINVFAKNVKERQGIKVANLETMLAYIKNEKTCRSKFLVDYFGELSTNDCGICDVCLKGTEIDNDELISEAILSQLKLGHQTSRKLTQTYPFLMLPF